MKIIHIFICLTLLLFVIGCAKEPTGNVVKDTDDSITAGDSEDSPEDNKPAEKKGYTIIKANSDEEIIDTDKIQEAPDINDKPKQDSTKEPEIADKPKPDITEFSQFVKIMDNIIEIEDELSEDSLNENIVETSIISAILVSLLQSHVHDIDTDCQELKYPEVVDTCDMLKSDIAKNTSDYQDFMNHVLPSGKTMRELILNPSESFCAGDVECLTYVAIIKGDYDMCEQMDLEREAICKVTTAFYHADSSFCELEEGPVELKIKCLKMFNIDGNLDDMIEELE